LHLQEAFLSYPNSQHEYAGQDVEMEEFSNDSSSSSSSKKVFKNGKGVGKEKGKGKATSFLEVAAADCELSYTTSGMSLTRVTVLDERGGVVFDSLVRPRSKIMDFNTRLVLASGLSDEMN